jgi:alkanesulfonate monooxygenase SsuD/methylene tetrahydromethanopterin reductase-like flavin-dependent oxidoreductase (luciferase family)
MDVGFHMTFGADGWEDTTDGQVYKEELALAKIADRVGFDCVWAVEHHFTDYGFCPDNLQLLSWVAAATENVDVGTAAVILPWHDPLRVAEKVALLDHLTDGRMRFGMGRGLARREYDAFRGVEMDESSERFSEAAGMILEALKSGFIQGDGPFYKQPRTEIRPRPERSFDGRIYMVAASDDSIDAAARYGGAMTMFADRPWEKRAVGLEKWRALHEEYHGFRPKVRPLACDFLVVCSSEDEAKELAFQHLTTYLHSVQVHYDMLGDHFSLTKGYEAYAAASKVLNKRGGESAMVQGFLDAAAWGTPDQVLAKLAKRRELLGDFELATTFRFGGMPFEKAKSSLLLFAAEVLPVLKTWG